MSKNSKKRKPASVPPQKNNKPKIVSEQVVRQSFAYQLGNITLSFQLRIDTDQEMKAFLQLMDRAKKDIETALAKV